VINTEAAIIRLRRDLTLSSLLKGTLLTLALSSFFIEYAGVKLLGGSVMLAGIGFLWLVLSYRSVKGSRIAAVSPSLIAAGNYEQAERTIDEALRSFSLFRTVKLRSLHHLAVLRHAQRRWGEAVILCRTLLTHRLGPLSGIARSTRLMLADSLLESNDVRGAYEALAGLYMERLSLAEALELQAVQLDYLWRVEAWDAMLFGLKQKVELSELMPNRRSARTAAMLALAARRAGRADLEAWLRRRAELLGDVGELVASRPVLAELWPARTSA
jgi:hypothetical protein